MSSRRRWIFALSSTYLALMFVHSSVRAEEESGSICPPFTVTSSLRKARNEELTVRTTQERIRKEAIQKRNVFLDLRERAKSWIEQNRRWMGVNQASPRISWLELSDLREMGEYADKPRPPMDLNRAMLPQRDYETWYKAKWHDKPVLVKVFDPYRAGSSPMLEEGYLAKFMSALHLSPVPVQGFVTDVAFDGLHLVQPEVLRQEYVNQAFSEVEAGLASAQSASGSRPRLPESVLAHAKAELEGLKTNWNHFRSSGKQDPHYANGIIAGLRDTLNQVLDRPEHVLDFRPSFLVNKKIATAIVYEDWSQGLELTGDADSVIIDGAKVRLSDAKFLANRFKLGNSTIEQVSLVAQQLQYVGVQADPYFRRAPMLRVFVNEGGRTHFLVENFQMPREMARGGGVPVVYGPNSPVTLSDPILNKIKLLGNGRP